MKYPKHIKKQLQEWSSEAYRRELAREIKRLDKVIAAWKSGNISNEELSYRVHTWDTGPAKALRQHYDYSPVDRNVAFAVVAGILQEHELPDELLAVIELPLHFYRDMKAMGDLNTREGEWWSA